MSASSKNVLTDGETKVLALSWLAMKTQPEIDIKKLATLAGHTNPGSTSNMWAKIKNKLKGQAEELTGNAKAPDGQVDNNDAPASNKGGRNGKSTSKSANTEPKAKATAGKGKGKNKAVGNATGVEDGNVTTAAASNGKRKAVGNATDTENSSDGPAKKVTKRGREVKLTAKAAEAARDKEERKRNSSSSGSRKRKAAEAVTDAENTSGTGEGPAQKKNKSSAGKAQAEDINGVSDVSNPDSRAKAQPKGRGGATKKTSAKAKEQGNGATSSEQITKQASAASAQVSTENAVQSAIQVEAGGMSGGEEEVKIKGEPVSDTEQGVAV